MTRPQPQQLSPMPLVDEFDDPIRHTTQSIVAERVRVEILSGRLSPGSRIRQADLAQRMRTSTTPVREALRELASEGLLHLDPHRGVIVHEPSEDELDEIYQMRRLLEPVSVAKSVEHISAGDIERARNVMTLMETEEDAGTWTVLNDKFHCILARGSGSPLLASIVKNLRNRSSQYVANSMRDSATRMGEANQEHAALLQACIDRDAEAAVDITRRHLEATVDHGAAHLG